MTPRLLCLAVPLVMAVSAFDSEMMIDWWLENALVFVLLAALIYNHRLLPLSNLAYWQIFVFLCFHEWGAHHKYADVPLGEWIKPWFQTTRNHYDRVMHLLYGLTFTHPMFEFFSRRATGWIRYALPLQAILATSATYEIIEWGVASTVNPEIGTEFVGAQGDPWDAEKDMALALGGSLLVTLGLAFRRVPALPLALLIAVAGTACAQQPKRILFFSHTAGFRHGSIEVAKRVLPNLAPTEFTVTSSEDLSIINAASLRNFDAIFFYTSGELALTDQQKRDLLEYVRNGGGFGGTHSATDCLYGWPEYGELIGGYFDNHPWTQKVRIDVEDPEHPIMAGFPSSFEITDEIYQFRAFSRDRVRVLMTLDPRSVDLKAEGVNRTDGDFALAWVRQYGQGRVFYIALGHLDEIFTDARIQRMLTNAFRWMTRLIEAPAAPRVSKPSVRAIVEAAQGGFEGRTSPGAIISIYGDNLTSGSTLAANAFRLAGTTVRLNNQPLSLFYASPGQINALVPTDVAPGSLEVEAGVTPSDPRALAVAAATPGIFALTLDRGILVLWTTGLGAVDGNNRTRAVPAVSVNSQAAEVQYSGLAPGFPGLYLVNARPASPLAAGTSVDARLDIAGAATTARLSILNP